MAGAAAHRLPEMPGSNYAAPHGKCVQRTIASGACNKLGKEFSSHTKRRRTVHRQRAAALQLRCGPRLGLRGSAEQPLQLRASQLDCVSVEPADVPLTARQGVQEGTVEEEEEEALYIGKDAPWLPHQQPPLRGLTPHHARTRRPRTTKPAFHRNNWSPLAVQNHKSRSNNGSSQASADILQDDAESSAEEQGAAMAAPLHARPVLDALDQRAQALMQQLQAPRLPNPAPALGTQDWNRQCLQVCKELMEAGRWRACHKLLRQAQAAAGVYPADEELGLSLLKAVIGQGSVAASLAQLRSTLGLLPGTQRMYVTALYHCRRQRSAKGVSEVVGWLHADRRLPQRAWTADTWRLIIFAYTQTGQLAAARRTFASMQRASAWDTADAATANMLLDGLHEDILLAFVKAKQLMDAGFVGDTVTYNTLLKACMRAKDVRRALLVRVWMKGAGVASDDITYISFIKVFAYAAEQAAAALGGLPRSAGAIWDLSHVLQVREWMVEDGHVGGPNVWGSLITAYGKAGLLAAAAGVWADMRAAGVPPTLDTTHAFMNACVWSYQGERALAVFGEMRQQGLVPCCKTYNIAMRACAGEPGRALQAGEVERALGLLAAMQGAGVVPDQFTYGTLIDLCGRARMGHRALHLLQEMEARGIRVERVTATLALQACGAAGLMAEAGQLWRRMVWGPARLRPNRQSYLTMARVCRENGALGAALHAYNGMRRQGFAPSNVEFQKLVVACAEVALQEDDPRAAEVAEQLGQMMGSGPVDLHGLSVAEARAAVLCVLSSLQAAHRQGQAVRRDLVIITGRGSHTTDPGGPKLKDSVAHLLQELSLPAAARAGDGGRGGNSGRLTVCQQALNRWLASKAKLAAKPDSSTLQDGCLAAP